MMINGKEFPGQLMKQEEARAIYEGIVRRKQDPALMEYASFGLFKTSVFPIQPGEERTITVHYTQILDKYDNAIEFTYPFGTQKFSAKALRSVKMTARIESSLEIKSIYSPTDELRVSKESDKRAKVSFEKSYVIPDHDFRMMFSMSSEDIGATLVSYRPEKNEPGYFLLMASPSVARENKVVTKSVVLVLDKSGSM